MIQKLQGKIVAMTMGVLVLMFLLSYGLAQYGLGHACGQMTQQVLKNLAEGTEGVQSEVRIQLGIQNNKAPLEGVLTLNKAELLEIINMPLYGLEVDREGQVMAFSGLDDRTLDLEDEEQQRIQQHLKNAENGYGETGTFRYYKAEKHYGYYIVLADRSRGLEKDMRQHLGIAMISVSIPLLLLMALISVFLARLVAKPTEEAFQRQKQFVSDAGHELKTPLSVINVNAAVLSGEIGPNKYMDCIREETDRMNGLIRQMLDVACIEDRSGEKKRFSLSEVVYQSTLPFESAAFERNIRYETRLQEGCFYTGDPDRIRQLMAILLDNAFKYGREGGEVSVDLHREGRRTVIEVYNTGSGIPEEDLPHIFERFYRCDKARPGNGSYGLGLAIAQSIVDACRGTITAESQEGAWARFRVTL